MSYVETEKANFRALARGGLTTEYFFLACYVDYTTSEYVLGSGPTSLTAAYDQLAEANSYDLYSRAHAAGEFGSESLVSESVYQAVLDQAVWDAESALSGAIEGRESVVFLAPMGAYHAIAIEAWRVIEQWDVQTVDGTVNAVRYGADPGDPEHTQTLANLKTRITTAATSDAFANNRIANVSGLQAYYTTIGAYEDITPDDGQTTTFTPAQPLPMRPCANGTAVPNPRDNRMLVQDCEVLLALKDTLAGTATLNWSTSTAISSWDGVTTGGTPSRVTRLVLTNKSLTGTIPPELAQLTGLTELKLDNNRLTGCIPLPLLQISNHDLDDLSLSYCGDPPPTPGGLSTSQADGTYTISWDAVTGADLYEVQHRAGTDADWVALPTTASTSATYSPEGGALCGPIEFRVRARGDGITFIPDWSEPTSASEVASTATSGLITDCELLLSIKGTLAGTSTLNWSMDTGIASWDGVTIGGTPSRITQLDLRINRLNGSIPSQIGSLDKLQQLYLGHNQLTGAIPPELGNLTELTQLWLNINQLTGPIPARLGDLTALVGLGLHYNRLTEEIPAELGNLTELEQMFLENNRLVGAIPLQLGGLDLSFISLAGNSLTGCIPVGLRDVRDNDLNTLGLAYCGAPPAPADLSVDLTAEAFSVEWSAVTGAASYEIKYRIAGSEAAWVTRPTTANTSGTFTPTGDSPCSGTYEFQVRAQGDGKGYEATWGAAAETTGTCNNVPAFGEESYAFSIAEDAALDAAVGSVSATDDDTGDTLTYAFTDEDTVEKFTIASATGAITVAVALDYETTPSYTLSVQVNDGNGGTASAEVVITVTNVPEGLPAAPTEVEVSLSGNTFTVTWGEVSGANEYEAQYRKDASEDWTSLEAVMSTSTAYTAAGVLNCGTTYDFQVRSHGDGETHLADWGEFSAPVSELVETDTCNNVPAFGEESYAFSIAEDAALDAAVGSVSATDDDTGDTLTYAFTDEDTVEKFAIASATGAITVAVALDYETTPFYTLSVQVNDGNGGTASAEVVITVTNVPEGLSAAPSEVEVSLSGNTFTVTWGEVSGANEYEAQYRKDASEDWTSLEAVMSTSTAYTAAGVLNCGTTYDFQVRSHGDGETHLADWGEFSAPVSELVETDTCNNVPAFGEESYAFSIAEDAALDAAVGSVSATDDDTGDTLTYAFTDEDTVEKFAIASATGAITVAVALDYETTPSYTLSVQVNDDNGGTASAEVVVTVTNVPEGLPPMPASLSVSLIDSTFSFTWDTVANAAKYRVQFHTGDGNWADAATDITGTSASFSPSDGPACGTTYSFQVLPFGDGVTYIEDWGTASDSESVTTDACNQIPAFTNAPYSFSVFEDAEVGYEVGTVTAEDLDTDDTLSFSISEGNEAGKFNISSSTGAITVAVALDYETTPSYTLNVQVNDDNGGISSSSVSISIIPLTCSNGVVVADVADNAGLVGDCQALLDGKQTLAGSAVLSWSARTAIANWDGIVLGGTPKRVTDLQLGSRGLSGSIPSTLGSLSNLTKLYLFNNQLSGAIPTQLGSLSNLTHLFLNSNRLTGSIPKEIGEISTLTNLSLGSNQLTESIPAELGRLSNLTSLVLNNNSLTGDLPTELGSLSSLQILWLQENQLSGTIPTELGALSNLTQLLLGYNQLTGSIPAELADLNNLESLQLKGNQLSGCIPPALRSVAKNDLNQIGLLNCAPAPQGLSVSLSDGTFSITWNAVTGASQFEVQYRTDSEEDWVSLPATAGTSSTFSPDGGPACGKTFEFQVRSFGDGATYGAAWGVSSDEVSQATSACS